MDTVLTLEMPGASRLGTGGSKRKLIDADVFEGSVHCPSLELALGHLPSLSDNGRTSSAIGSFDGNAMRVENMSPVCYAVGGPVAAKPPSKSNLLFGLSSGAPASVVTNASLFHGSTDTSIYYDDGSTSSCLKPGTSVLSFGALESTEVFNNRTNHVKTNQAYTAKGLTTVMSVPRPTTCTSGTNKTHRGPGTKTCLFQGCTKGARGASGLCISHGGGRRCQREGCCKGAEGRTIFCKAHGGGRRCEHFGCMKSAEGRSGYCIAHGGGRRCGHAGCSRAARGKSGLCIKHGGGKRCQKEGCTRSAEGFSGLCISHGGGRRCVYPKCAKGAQGSTPFCKAHGGGKRCTVAGCSKGAEGSTLFCKAHGGGKRCSFQGGGCPKSVHGGTLFCVAHGGGKRCAKPGCGKSARGRTDFCVRHGGGKRCKAVDCGKSAQGRTDFCKAHGGGTRCSWGKPDSGLGSEGPPCSKLASARTGLCASHTVAVEERRIRRPGTLGWIGDENAKQSKVSAATSSAGSWNVSDPLALALPEGRVHGGGLMAMLASGAAHQLGVPRPAPEWLGRAMREWM